MTQPAAPPPTQLPALMAPAASRAPQQQLGDLPEKELAAIAEEYGLDPRQHPVKSDLVAAIHARRQLIASLDKKAMLDVLRWAGRTPPPGATSEHLAIEVVHVKVMRFNGLSTAGLTVLALLRGCEINGEETRDQIVSALKSQEGFFAKVRRKTRGWVGKRIERMIGDPTTQLPPEDHKPGVASGPTISPPRPGDARPSREPALRDQIEESGFFTGIANRVKKQADSYVNQKLDEIEARIDRKLDEIDRRLAEWRDKEIANRIRILKITLWASVVVAAISLIYSYVQIEMKTWERTSPTHQSTTPTPRSAPPPITNATAPPTETPTSPPSSN
ncbi:MAG TPA: hypothetical protein VF624_02635 [Tepidisphaeraceae bacterium]|jgi:hypothetical protein